MRIIRIRGGRKSYGHAFSSEKEAMATQLVMEEEPENKGSYARGMLKYELVEGHTAATYVFATYPLKFLHPRRAVRQGFDTFITVSDPILLLSPLLQHMC